jgi:hypothetical protein
MVKFYVIEVCGCCIPPGSTVYVSPDGSYTSDITKALFTKKLQLPKDISRIKKEKNHFRFVEGQYVLNDLRTRCISDLVDIEELYQSLFKPKFVLRKWKKYG